ncbi:hypothetical protein HRbin04_01258 [archaeon HR04]|nr:hypothetical protein HRbin04_01258 [archaeon HR04]
MEEEHELINSYIKYLKYVKEYEEKRVIDLSDVNFFYPTTLLPLLIYIQDNKCRYIKPNDRNIANYFELIKKGEMISNKPSSDIPLILLKENESYPNPILDNLKKWLSNIYPALEYIIGELVDNIYQHSRCESAYIMAQRYDNRGFIEFALIDDGITIKGSLLEGKKIDANQDDSIAIYKALEGYSSKAERGRGYGLSTLTRLITEVLKGEIFLASGKGLMYLTERRGFISDIDRRLKGTLISIRLVLKLVNTMRFDLVSEVDKYINLKQYSILPLSTKNLSDNYANNLN